MKTRKLAAALLSILASHPGAHDRENFNPEAIAYLDARGAIKDTGPDEEYISFAG